MHRAAGGETLKALDEKEYTFGAGQMVISDANGPESIGGDLVSLEGGVSRLIGSWKALAAAAGGVSIAGSFREVVNQADQIGKAARKIGVTSEALSRLGFAASRENINFSALEVGLQRMTRRIGAAQTGSKELQKVFQQLGLDVNELANLNPDEAFLRIADATRAVTNEKEQLALFFKIFDTEGVNLIRLARQGSDGIRELGDEAERLGKVFGSEFTANAEKFGDAMTDLEARFTGVKVNTFTPVLENLVEFLDNVGLGDRVTGLRTELLLLEEQLKKPLVFDRRGVERRADAIRSELKLIERRKQAAKTEADAQAAAAATKAAANREYQVSLDEVTASYTAQQKARQAALNLETRELAAARAQQTTIEQEFKSLVEDITAPDVQEVGLADIFGSINQATASLENDNLDEAIELARKGGDLLGKLKEKGTESDLVLKFFAERLGKVANEAAKQKVELELVDQKKAQEQLDGVKNKMAALKTDAVQQGQDVGRAFVAAIQAELAAAELKLPAVAAPEVVGGGGQAEASAAPGANQNAERKKRGFK